MPDLTPAERIADAALGLPDTIADLERARHWAVRLEQENAELRRTVANFIYRCNDGGGLDADDIAWRLEQAGLSVQPELDAIAAEADAR